VSDFVKCKGELLDAIERARSVVDADRRSAEKLLERPVIRFAKTVALRRTLDLAATTDVDHVQSVVTQAGWESIRRVDLSLATPQIFQYFLQRATHAVSDAARAADPLPRRARTYRNRVLAVIDGDGLDPDEALIRRLAREMYPQVTEQTLELMVRGAPPPVDVDRPDVADGLVEDTDPVYAVAQAEVADALHVIMADQPDPVFRAWAAAVLCGEDEGRRVPKRLGVHAEQVRGELAGWVR
jgi:hypothetical protein